MTGVSDPPNAVAREDTPPHGWAAQFFILRPVFGLLLAVLLVAWGAIAYRSMVKESLPDLEIPQATISTTYPGADPNTIEQEITEKIERELSTLRGVKRVRSASFDSVSLIGVEFTAESELSESMQLLRGKIDDAESELPDAAEKSTVTQVSVDDRPIISLILYGDVDAAVIGRAAKALEDRLESLPGVNEVRTGGLREEVILVQLRQERLAALGITPTAVQSRIAQAGRDAPLGNIDSDVLGATVRLYGRFRNLEDLKSLPIERLPSGRVVRLDEVAEVRRDLEAETSRAFASFDGSRFERAVDISLTKVPGSDTLQTIERAKQELEAATSSADWPHGLKYRTSSDQSDQIWESLLRVFNNAWQAMIGVFVVLFLMLTWREALIAGLSIPLTFAGAMGIVWTFGYTLNEMVLIGMVLALGLLVDVFILMMEGMHDGIFVERLPFPHAAMKTVKRYAVPAFAGQATTVLALAPLIAISGTSGKFIRILPITSIACLVTSFAVALLVDVPLSRYLLASRAGRDEQPGFVDNLTQRIATALARFNLATTVRNRWFAGLAVLTTLGLFVASGIAFGTIPSTLYADKDGKNLGVGVELPAGTTIERSHRCGKIVGEILREKGYLDSVVMLVGKKSPFMQGSLTDALSPTTGDYLVGFSCTFVEREDRDRPAYEFVPALRDEITAAVDAEFPGASVQLQAETGQPTSGDPVQIEIIGNDMGTLRSLSAEVQQVVRNTPGTADVRDNLGNVVVDLKLRPKRESLDFYGITTDELASQLRFAMTDVEVGKFAVDGLSEDLEIRMSTFWSSRGGRVGGPTEMEELVSMRAFQADGKTVPLIALVDSNVGTTPISIVHQDGRRSVAVMSKATGRLASEIVAEVTPKLQDIAADWPTGYDFKIGGEAEEAAETFGSAGTMLGVSLFLVFALLVLLFGSFTQPFVIVLTIPMALIGTFTGFFAVGMPFSFTAMIGLISLIGIVVNDAIVMVETMNERLRHGESRREAAARGGADRLRPILSTSITTTIGLIPLALSDPMWEPLCFAIIFGLAASTVLSLLVIPSLFLLLTRKQPGDTR